MSTKPPTAVMIPKVSSSGFKTFLDLPDLADVHAQSRGGSIVRQPHQRPYFTTVAAIGVSERTLRRLQLLPQLVVHGFDIGLRKVALGRLFVDERPFGRQRPSFADGRQVGVRAFGTAPEQQRKQRSQAHARTTVSVADRSRQPWWVAISRPFRDSVRKVMEKRNRSPGAMLCSHSHRDGPESR